MGSHTLRISSETYKKIEAVAYVRNLTMTDVVGRAMDYYVESSPVKDAVYNALNAKRNASELPGGDDEQGD